MTKASDVFLDIVRRHLQVLERRTGYKDAASNDDHAEESVDEVDSQLADDDPVVPMQPKALVTHVDRNPRPFLEALDTDPAVTASTVAEYDFCPRAGILTHEGGYSDPEEEMPSLSLLPWYEQDAIEEAYARSCLRLFWWLIGLVAGLVIVAISPLFKQADSVSPDTLGGSRYVGVFHDARIRYLANHRRTSFNCEAGDPL